MKPQDQRQTVQIEVGTLVRVPRSFYARHALLVAPELLGLVLIHQRPEGTTAGIISEVEAYVGTEDPACHAYQGRRTRRNNVMYGPPGFAYVYFTYGMHYCFNVVVAEQEVPHAVLVRSLEPLLGQDLMLQRRGGRLPLAEGPARLCQAMAIGQSENGKDLVESNLYIALPPENLLRSFKIEKGPRIGVDYAGAARLYPWRFWICAPSP